MSRKATKNATIQAAGDGVRFTVYIDGETHKILCSAHDTLNYRQVAQVALAQFAEALKAQKQEQVAI